MKLFRTLVAAVVAVWTICLAPWPAHSQTTVNAITVSSCGSLTLTAGLPYAVVQDTTGKLCTSSTGGGGGGAVTMASGAVASGAYSAGSIAAGAMVDFGTGASPAANTLLYDLTNAASPLISSINSPIPTCTIGTNCGWLGQIASYQTLTNSPNVTVATTATLVAAARTGNVGTGRGLITVTQKGASPTEVDCGPSNAVTTGTGQFLAPIQGASATFQYQGAVYCISLTTSNVVSVAEQY